MKRYVSALAMVALLPWAAACFQHTYTVGSGAPEGTVVYKQWHHHWLFGLIRPQLQRQVDVDRFCPSGNATVHQEVSFVNGLVDVLIGVIYSPTTVTIRCDTGEEASVELSADAMAHMARQPGFVEVVDAVAPDRLDELQLALQRAERETTEAATVRARR